MFSPAEVAKNYINIGKGKANQTTGKMFLLAILAGMFIAMAGMAATFGNVYVNKVVGAAIFPAGLAMVLIAGSELFTGNCLLIIPLLEKEITAAQMLRNWLIVYLGNMVGGLLVTAMAVFGGTFDGVYDAVIATAATKATLPFASALLRGILCNVLVCLGVWMSFAAKSVGGKIAGLFFPVFVFVVCGFEHSIANMFYIPAGLMEAARFNAAADGLTVYGMLVRNLLPVTLGNIIGGCGVGAFYWGIYLKK
ncbi:MAG: formate/nitrite transporter family protein [Clostridiales bacterium]|nr:formate/nitrite transporter family protein [Candidatus Cacconaster stercorequi]